MKIAALIARILLALMFLIFGFNGFLHFIPSPPPPPGLAAQFAGALYMSHYLVAVFLVQIVGGALLLVRRYVPLALILLGPIVVNILLFHLLLSPAGAAPGVLAAVLWIVVFVSVWDAFSAILTPQKQSLTL